MHDPGITPLIDRLVGFDPDVAERDELGARLRDLNRIQGWVDHAKVRCSRRLAELSAAGRSESAANALMDEGRRSGKEARAIEERERICSEFPELEDALATGAVSTDHLDALNRMTRNLSDAERSDLHAIADDIVGSATNDWVSEFERKTKGWIDHIKTVNAPADESAELDRQRAESRMKRWTDQASGLKMTLLALDPLRDAALHTAVDAQIAALRNDPTNADRPFAQLQVEAVVAAVSRLAGGRRVPEVVVHIDAASACHGRHAATVCETADGEPLPVSTVQRLCCEAIISAVVLDAGGNARMLSSEERTANREQRRALAAMYATCAHPHCTIGFSRCRIHHVIWWTNGGRTVLDNPLPLCEMHHHEVHEGGWNLQLAPDTREVAWFRPDGTIWATSRPNRRPDRQVAPAKPVPPPPTCPDTTATEWRQPRLC